VLRSTAATRYALACNVSATHSGPVGDGDLIMNPRLATIATLGREVAIPALVLAWIGTASFASIDNTRATPVAVRLAPSLAADVKLSNLKSADINNEAKFSDAKIPEVAALDIEASDVKTSDVKTRDVETSDVKLADTPVAAKPPQLASAAPDFPPPSDLSLPSGPSLASIPATVAVTPDATPAPASREAEPIVTAALTDTSEKLSPDAPPGIADATTPGTTVRSEVDSVEVLDECFVIEACVDRYLFALYQRAPKEDTVAVEDKRQVTIKRKGKTVTVTRTFTRRADQDFAWKDPKAAEKAGMSMPQYVIGGMDRDFKMKLFRLLLAAEQAGQYPGITSAFRDDYRQSIASGLKAANDRSYHGGSFRGGYGHGLAADIISINGATRGQRLASTQAFWKWVDAHGKDYGIGRPYLDHDPPHVGPIDGKEYADKHPGAAHRAEAASKPAHRAKRVRTARS
jgi:hypothetical protein